MILENRMKDIIKWHSKNGGFARAGRLGPHAVRLLREAVELCIACGSPIDDILDGVYKEIRKQTHKRYAYSLSPTETISSQQKQIEDEIADVQLLLFVLAYFNKTNINPACVKKIDILNERKWKADENGVLWRDDK